jgi:hypothetical protein
LADVHEPWLARTVITDDLAGDLFEPLSIGTMVRRVADMAVEKASRSWALLMRSLVGGAMVAFGVVLSLVVSTGVTTPGVASLLMGLVFGMSFVLILVSGMSLITADMAAGFLAVLQRRMSASAYCRLLVVGFGQYDRRADLRGHLCCRRRPVPGRLRRARSNRWRPESRATALHRTASRAAVHMVPAHLNVHVLPGPQRRRPHGIRLLWPLRVCHRRHPARHRQRRLPWAPMLLAAFHASAPHSGIGWGFGSHDFLTSLCITALGNLLGGTLFVAMPFQVIAWLEQRAN